jgi:hypothetical protein
MVGFQGVEVGEQLIVLALCQVQLPLARLSLVCQVLEVSGRPTASLQLCLKTLFFLL